MNQNFTNRVRLLMEYDTSTTESENNDRIFKKNVLNEQGGIVASSLKSGFAGTFDDILRNVKGGLKTLRVLQLKTLMI